MSSSSSSSSSSHIEFTEQILQTRFQNDKEACKSFFKKCLAHIMKMESSGSEGEAHDETNSSSNNTNTQQAAVVVNDLSMNLGNSPNPNNPTTKNDNSNTLLTTPTNTIQVSCITAPRGKFDLCVYNNNASRFTLQRSDYCD